MDKEFKINQIIQDAWGQWKELMAPEKDKDGNIVKDEGYLERIKKYVQEKGAPNFVEVDNPAFAITGENKEIPGAELDLYGGNTKEAATMLVKFIEFMKAIENGDMEAMRLPDESYPFEAIADSVYAFIKYYAEEASQLEIEQLLGAAHSDELKEISKEAPPAGIDTKDWDYYQIWYKNLSPVEVRKNPEVEDSVREEATKLGVKLTEDGETKKPIDSDIEDMLSGIEVQEDEART